MGLTLDMSPRALEEVIYFAAYVVIDPKDTPLEHKSIMTEREYRERLREYGYGSFVAKMGAEAIQDLLKQVDLEKEIAELKEELKTATGSKNVLKLFVVWTFLMPSTSLVTNQNGWCLTSCQYCHRTFVQWFNWMVDVLRHLT